LAARISAEYRFGGAVAAFSPSGERTLFRRPVVGGDSGKDFWLTSWPMQPPVSLANATMVSVVDLSVGNLEAGVGRRKADEREHAS
jgi:hypothetical protein